jgi:microcystin-dependent protein
MSNTCYNGCVETVSDNCVKYTGVDIPALNIHTGDPLSHIEEMITCYLTPLLTGIGDDITITDTCSLVTQYLTTGNVHNSSELFNALTKAVCNLQTQIVGINSQIAPSPYTVRCLTGVTSTSSTHAVLQAVINLLCQIQIDLGLLAVDVDTNYVKLANLNALIAAYIAGTGNTSTQNYLKMVPYTVLEYYGSLTNFDSTGKGIAAKNFDKIYLCNGLNGTPDKRGRVAVGAIAGVPGGALDSAVNPTIAGNPNYAINDGGGANTIALNATQIPAHTHSSSATSTSSVTDPGHLHYIVSDGSTNDLVDGSHVAASNHSDGGNLGYKITNSTAAVASTGKTNTVTTGVTVSTTTNVTIAPTGNGVAHSNIQPVKACYYIMYIPS